MDTDNAVIIVNDIHDQLALLARAIVTALRDGKVSILEGFTLGMKGMALAEGVIVALQGSTAEERQAILSVLEHGTWIMPPPA